MKVEEFFAQYEEDEQMMGQILEASKDENTLVEFLGSHGVEVEPAGSKKELSDEEMSQAAGGHAISADKCKMYCEGMYFGNEEALKNCIEWCKKTASS